MEELPANSVENEIVEQPREGTLAWLQQQPHEDVLGLQLPACHRIPEGATLAEANGHCRVIKLGAERCRAPATRSYGICLGHLGGGAMRDPVGAAKRAGAAKARLRLQRNLLGIGANRVGSARQRARLEAAARAADVAEALLAPLDDSDLGAMARQAAAVKILDATEPIQTAQIEVEIPADESGVQGLSWQQMQALAAKLLA